MKQRKKGSEELLRLLGVKNDRGRLRSCPDCSNPKPAAKRQVAVIPL